jgi:LuxR family transcriptional regulator of csgAB operon
LIPPSPKHKTVCVIGPSRLQNELIASSFEAQGDVKCVTAASLDEARVRFEDLYRRIELFLWDWAEKDLARKIKALKSIEGLMPRNSSLGLFNVRRESWDNGMALPPQVKGILLEDSSVEDFTKAVGSLLKGESWFPVKKRAQDPATSKALAGSADSRNESLTPREQLLLALILQGKTNQQIADALGLKYKTIKNYANILFRKINVSNRVEATLWAKKRLR